MVLYASQDKTVVGFEICWVCVCIAGRISNYTLKSASFLGHHEDWVACGSDCGNLFLWPKKSESTSGMVKPFTRLKGDSTAINCIQPHPTYPMVLATSGIDSDVKIWNC